MRALRVSLIALVVLVGLAVGADRLGLHLAEDKAAEQLRDRMEAQKSVRGSVDTSVSIDGFPFLTQLVSHDFDDVSLEFMGLTARTNDKDVRISKVNLHGSDVHTNGDFSSVRIERAKGRAFLSYDDLSGIVGGGTRVSWAGKDEPDKVRVTKEIPLVGELTVTSSAAVKDRHSLRLNADEIDGDIGGIAKKVVEGVVRERFDRDWAFEELPKEITFDEVRPTASGLVIELSGKDVRFGD